jgi:hypothetical protein
MWNKMGKTEDKIDENICFQDILESDFSISTIDPEIPKEIFRQSREIIIQNLSDKRSIIFSTYSHYEQYEYTEI